MLLGIVGIYVSELITNKIYFKICKYIAEETQNKNIDGLGTIIDYIYEKDYSVEIECSTQQWMSIFNLLTGIIFVGFGCLCFPKFYTTIFFGIGIDQLYYCYVVKVF
uniref:Uncharacterized protein n=1 Tax=Mimivirus LCMiAC02 TaxID=2506609 RepID=A0A4D5XEY5_9VIRU|nr:MAG: hypothetical protein LCMiAC02_03180 [Mimivirus LCMiAC02]